MLSAEEQITGMLPVVGRNSGLFTSREVKHDSLLPSRKAKYDGSARGIVKPFFCLFYRARISVCIYIVLPVFDIWYLSRLLFIIFPSSRSLVVRIVWDLYYLLSLGSHSPFHNTSQVLKYVFVWGNLR